MDMDLLISLGPVLIHCSLVSARMTYRKLLATFCFLLVHLYACISRQARRNQRLRRASLNMKVAGRHFAQAQILALRYPERRSPEPGRIP